MKDRWYYEVILDGGLLKVPVALTEEQQMDFMIRKGIRDDSARIHAENISKFKRHLESSET